MNKQIKYLSAIIAFCLGLSQVNAQQVNTMYFIENIPIRHYMNPAFQPLSDIYFGLPALGYTQFGHGNNSLRVKSFQMSQKQLFRSIRPNTLFNGDMHVNLLNFGFRHDEGYWSFALTEKVDGIFIVPKDVFKLALYGTPKLHDNIYNFGALNLRAQAYTEIAAGYARKLNEQWSVGMKLKGLIGNANMSAYFNNFDLEADIDQWKINADGYVNVSAPAKVKIQNKPGSIQFDPEDPINIFNGFGLGADLGGSFKPIEELTVSAALLDLGFIGWGRNAYNIQAKVNETYEGIDFSDSNFKDKNWMQAAIDTTIKRFENAASYTSSNKNYTTSISPKLNIGAEYAFLENQLSVGLLSHTFFHPKAVFQEFTGSVNLRPVNWFNMSLSYSLLNGRFSSIGAGTGIRIGPVNLFMNADYIPMNHTTLDLEDVGLKPIDVSNIPLLASKGTLKSISMPYNTNRFNLNFGIIFVIGNKEDKDKDGVWNKLDKCPDTPRGVVVDKDGCPVDTDGDGVPDYLDKCPDTPKEARGMIDEQGCPRDTDGDSVPDYLDKCPDTPKEAYGKIDKEGCPLDSDEDGVPDYLDECPGTPIEANKKVDSKGCLLDTDKDGVPDYLDKCPNTPAEARGMIDKDGCPLDSDGDSVPDYLDKCPDTPKEAWATVDEKGCPRDTDGDGILDYKDNCPKLRGTIENKGCPEIKKEVRTLFQKALQGIQFETGKAVIRVSSYVILNQIANVLKENPDYLVEVQGHTDNVGAAEYNQVLSERRARAVRDYLVDKGVAEKRITSNGYGYDRPVAPNTTAKGRAKNRRVEFIVSFEEVEFEKIKIK